MNDQSENAHTEPIFPLHIAVLEQDALLRERILLPALRDHGFNAIGLSNVDALEQLLVQQVPDIILLDVGLPDADGFLLAHRLRSRFPAMGVLILTARHGVAEHVRGLLEGADAYLTKPVHASLLIATVLSVARRLPGARLPALQSPAACPAWTLLAGGWRLQSPCGGSVSLTRSERPLVGLLLAQPGEVVGREQLVACLTHDVFEFDTHRLDSLIHRLRRKVAGHCSLSLPLTAVHGQGYVFAP